MLILNQNNESVRLPSQNKQEHQLFQLFQVNVLCCHHKPAIHCSVLLCLALLGLSSVSQTHLQGRAVHSLQAAN